MGSCVSLHKDPDSTMRFRLGAKRFLVPSPAKEKPLIGENPVAEYGFKSKAVDSGFGSKTPDFGSKEETFFDSRGWLESDCEDDFLSVNGEFTPSRGSTPNNQTSTPVTPQLNKAFFIDTFPYSKSEPSPTDKRKKLGDLLQETPGGDHVEIEQNVVDGKVDANAKLDGYKSGINHPPKLSDRTPYMSGENSTCSSEGTPNRDSKHGKEKAGKATYCCLPSLVQSLSFNERKVRRRALDAAVVE